MEAMENVVDLDAEVNQNSADSAAGSPVSAGKASGPAAGTVPSHKTYPRVDWAVPNFAARGELTMLWADGGVGTSTTLITASAAWTTGQCFLGLPSLTRPLHILASCPETDYATMIEPAFELQGGDQALFHFIDPKERRSLLKNDGALLRGYIEEFKPDLVWLDPLISHTVDVGWGDAGEARKSLDMLQEIARECRLAIILRDHWNKTQGYTSPTHRSSGSVQKVNTPRINFVAAPCPGEPYAFVLSLDKHNLRMEFEDRLLRTVELGPDTDALGVQDLGASDKSVKAILAMETQRVTGVSPTEAVRRLIKAFPRAVLTIDQVADVFDHTPKAIGTAVSRLVQKGLIDRVGSGFRKGQSPG
jgi:hypothetical protein